MKLLVAGFRPFGGRRTNPAEWVVRRMRRGEIPGAEIVRAVLPATWRGSEQVLLGLVRRHRPDAVVCLGLAPASARLRLEIVALNVDHCPSPDGAREKRERRKIDPRGPWVRETRLPVDAILAAWKRARVPGVISHHAGTYLCNHVFYVLLGATRARAGFVHVPPRRRMKGATLLRGVRALLKAISSPPPTVRDAVSATLPNASGPPRTSPSASRPRRTPASPR